MMDPNFKIGLEPLLCENPRILVLGSLPSDKSIQRQEYYGNPKNLFWRVIAGVFDTDIPTDYNRKINLLANKGIVLWDIYHSAHREGSLDSNIAEPEFNDIASLLRDYPSIKTIALNGGTAEKGFKRYRRTCNPDLSGITIIPLKSTSSMVVTAGWNLERLTEQWRLISEI
ncbi:MAG: DNA-deoxyinosine glycosylase [Bacteroidales bacterium]|nr:DNA-deoxyinosine glycosylase [Bacteroidales bacterium]